MVGVISRLSEWTYDRFCWVNGEGGKLNRHGMRFCSKLPSRYIVVLANLANYYQLSAEEGSDSDDESITIQTYHAATIQKLLHFVLSNYSVSYSCRFHFTAVWLGKLYAMPSKSPVSQSVVLCTAKSPLLNRVPGSFGVGLFHCCHS
jgi:hypothetical protein